MKTAYRALLICMMTAFAIAGICGDLLSDSPSTTDINGAVSFVQGQNGAITVSFPAQSGNSIPRYDAVTVVAGNSSGDPAFSGNYTEMGVDAVSFNIASESTVLSPVLVQLVLRSSGSGRVWRNESVSASAVGGQVVVNQVSFERSSGWTRDGGGDLDAMWAADLQSVEVIGVRLAKPNREAISYTISEFIISGETFGTTPATLTPLEQALKDQFGVTSAAELTETQKAQDGDGDGMADFVEIMSENDDEYANSIFVAEIVSITEAGVLLRWPTVAGSSYTVIRSASLMEEFQDLQGAVSIPAATTGYMTHLDASGAEGGPYFYKIRREP